MLGRIIHESISTERRSQSISNNGNLGGDVFDGAFLNSHLSRSNLDLTGVAHINLKYRTTANVSLMVYRLRNANQWIIPVGLCHYIFNPNMRYRMAFPDFVLIDIMPRDGNLLLPTILQICKSALRKNPEIREIRIGQHTDCVLRYHEQHGHWPEWWAYFGVMPFNDFLRRYARILAYEMRHQTIRFATELHDSDLMLDSIEFLFGKSFDWLSRFTELTGVTLTDDALHILHTWQDENQRLFGTHEISCSVDKDEIDVDRVYAVMCDALLPLYHEMFDDQMLAGYYERYLSGIDGQTPNL